MPTTNHNDNLYNFILNGTLIYYSITDDDRPIQSSKEGQKMSRFITFYNANKQVISTKSIYGTVEQMQNITSRDAKEWYVNSIENQNE